MISADDMYVDRAEESEENIVIGRKPGYRTARNPGSTGELSIPTMVAVECKRLSKLSTPRFKKR